MTVERSKRRFLIPIVFITKCFKKPLLFVFCFFFFRLQKERKERNSKSQIIGKPAHLEEIEITSWKARAYGIFTRVGEVSEIERVSAANE